MLCFSIGNRPQRSANYRSCFSNLCWVNSMNYWAPPVKAQWCTIHQYSCTILQYSFALFISYSSAPFISTAAAFFSPVLHHSSVVKLHHSLVLFCTIRQHSSAPFISSVLHHSLATILCHVIMLFYNSESTNNLATDANTLCQLFNCITKS